MFLNTPFQDQIQIECLQWFLIVVWFPKQAMSHSHDNHICKRYEMKSTMFSGPIMPRITECLAQRQEVAPEEVEEVSDEDLEWKTNRKPLKG